MGNYHARFYEGLGRGDAPSLLCSGNNSQFSYDAMGRNVKILEYTASSLTSTKQFVWALGGRRESRDSSGTIVEQYFPYGYSASGSSFFFTSDHQTSLREIVQSGAVQGVQSYDMYGQPVALQGTFTADFGYGDYYIHSRSGLNLTRTRPYASKLGRFIQQDTIGIKGGTNQYAYVLNDPVDRIDPSGMDGLLIASGIFVPDPFVIKPNPFFDCQNTVNDEECCDTQYKTCLWLARKLYRERKISSKQLNDLVKNCCPAKYRECTCKFNSGQNYERKNWQECFEKLGFRFKD